MQLAIYTSGMRTHMGVRNAGAQVTQNISVDSRLIFQNKKLLGKRLELTLQKYFGITKLSEVQDACFGLSGNLDLSNQTIIKSYILNQITFPRDYNDFSFTEALDGFIEKDKVHIVNDSYVAGAGAYEFYKTDGPMLVITIDRGVGVCFVSPGGEIDVREWGEDTLSDYKELSIHQLLGDRGIDEILFSNQPDALDVYTRRLAEVVQYLAGRISEEGFRVGTVAVLSSKREFIDTEVLKGALNMSLVIVPDSSEYSQVLLTGCFSATQKTPLADKPIKNIKYYAGGEHIHTFNTFDKFVNHFIDAKPIAYGENLYKIRYLDGSKRKVKIKELKYTEELEQFRF